MYNEIFGESIVKEKSLSRSDAKSTFFDVSDLSLSELTANSLFFVLSGYETVANALALTVLCLAEHPECQKKLTGEIRAGLGTRNSIPQKDVSISADKRK